MRYRLLDQIESAKNGQRYHSDGIPLWLVLEARIKELSKKTRNMPL
jgi:hypothetical protein